MAKIPSSRKIAEIVLEAIGSSTPIGDVAEITIDPLEVRVISRSQFGRDLLRHETYLVEGDRQ